jgi:hypothetical protein
MMHRRAVVDIPEFYVGKLIINFILLFWSHVIKLLY